MKGPTDDFLAQLIKLGLGPNPTPRTIEQMAAAPANLTTAKDVVDKMEQGIETRLAKINADRAALKQSDDLKAVYDKTFDKLVTAPAVAMENSAKALDSGIDAALALATYINAGRAADEGVPGRRRAFRRRATAKRPGVGGELGRRIKRRHPSRRASARGSRFESGPCDSLNPENIPFLGDVWAATAL
jgi:hypothetical protein